MASGGLERSLEMDGLLGWSEWSVWVWVTGLEFEIRNRIYSGDLIILIMGLAGLDWMWLAGSWIGGANLIARQSITSLVNKKG